MADEIGSIQTGRMTPGEFKARGAQLEEGTRAVRKQAAASKEEWTYPGTKKKKKKK